MIRAVGTLANRQAAGKLLNEIGQVNAGAANAVEAEHAIDPGIFAGFCVALVALVARMALVAMMSRVITCTRLRFQLMKHMLQRTARTHEHGAVQ